MMLMASGVDLIVLFLGLETMALSFYVLTGFLRREKRSNEAALKYVLLGAFSSGILAYGFSLLYGLSASTNIVRIGAALGQRDKLVQVIALSQQPGAAGQQMRNILQAQFPLALRFDPFLLQVLPILAFVLVAVGLFFKVAAVPFHQWAPDVYEGAPTPVTTYVSVASKTASFALLFRLFLSVFAASQETWMYLVAGIAVASLTWGNLAALTQTNVKRLLAYSSISHVGYILLGLVAFNDTAFTGIAYYLFAYVFMTAGAFAVIIVLRQKGLIGDELEDLNGLYQRSPAAALLLLIFMLSLAGIPPTAGFMGKYFIFLSLIETKHPLLAVFAVLYIVPALYYYFRIIVHAWLKQPGDAPRPVLTSAQAVALGVAVFVTLAAGLYPEPFTRLAHYAFAFGQ
jgi:NADH-quinone oxidoreductase subunit N